MFEDIVVRQSGRNSMLPCVGDCPSIGRDGTIVVLVAVSDRLSLVDSTNISGSMLVRSPLPLVLRSCLDCPGLGSALLEIPTTSHFVLLHSSSSRRCLDCPGGTACWPTPHSWLRFFGHSVICMRSRSLFQYSKRCFNEQILRRVSRACGVCISPCFAVYLRPRVASGTIRGGALTTMDK